MALTIVAATSAAAVSAAPSHGVKGAAARQQAFNAYVKQTGGATTANHTPNDGDLADLFAAYANERTAPASFVSGAALISAQQQASALPTTGSAWQEVTNAPYNSEPSGYTDPNWGNQGVGSSLVGGRTTALAETADGSWFAGTADGGVWRSVDQGKNWVPASSNLPTLSIGALTVAPDGSLWVGTGEANLAVDNYQGTGVYRSTDHGASWQVVAPDSSGNSPMVSRTIFRIAFDQAGDAYAATSNGLFRLAAGASQWQEVLDPAGATDYPPYDQQVTSVAVVPHTNGTDVIAAIGWHGPGHTENNGFYESTDSGLSFTMVTPAGKIDAKDIGRTTFAYSADGTKLYAIVQSPSMLAAGDASVMQGIFVSSGSPASVKGPWTLIADAAKLSNSGSANAYGPNSVGAQAWYNQDLAVDPNHSNHIYAGLEEVFESSNGGSTWDTASAYWNYPFACDQTNPPTCPNVTHPDQHAMMIADGQIVIGNDGGVYSRPLGDTGEGNWADLNATLHSWQYYDARAGALKGGGIGTWGGLQDNGTSLMPDGASQMVEPAGGDGFDVIVDPKNANNMVGEYTYGTMYSSTDGGHSFNPTVSPTCFAEKTFGVSRSDCDPSARFLTPLVQDQQRSNVWVAGGRYVWLTSAGWNTSCTNSACSWKNVYDTGAGHAVTALSSVNGGSTIYAAWVAGGGNPGPSFGIGIATNVGGTWHEVNTAGLPSRFIAGLTVDPANPKHAYAIFNGYSRRWVPSAGVGHVFETTDGGQTWADISGTPGQPGALPDVPSDSLVMSNGSLALATDLGVFTASAGQGTSTTWSRLGTGLPNVSVNDLTRGPGGDIYAATHGRGIWRIGF